MCHFDILTVCHAVTKTTPFIYIYKYILFVYLCSDTHNYMPAWEAAAVSLPHGQRKKNLNGAGNLNLCHLLITPTHAHIHTHTHTHSCQLTVLWRTDLSCMDLCLCFCIVLADISLFFLFISYTADSNMLLLAKWIKKAFVKWLGPSASFHKAFN